MKKIIAITVLVIAILLIGYASSRDVKDESVYSNSELGIELAYRSGPNGYVLEEMTPADSEGDLVKTIVLTRTEDKMRGAPIGGEGSPTITISVFKNSKNQWSGTWADENIQHSNINLKTSDVAEAVIGGANAVRYMADGLYASENVVVTHGNSVYVFTGSFMDENSDLRLDFGPLIESVRFVE